MSRLVLLSTALTALGCGSTAGLELYHHGPALRTEAFAVGDVVLNATNAQAWDQYAKIRDVLGAIESTEHFLAIAPWEFDRIEARPGARAYPRQSNLFPRLERLGLDPQRVVVLEMTIEENTHDQEAGIERRGKPEQALGRAYESHLSVQIQVIHPASGRRLARIHRARAEDRFVDVPDTDPRPQLTALVRETVSDLLEALVDKGVLLSTAEHETPTWMWENPIVLLDYERENNTLRHTLAKMSPLLAESQLYSLLRYHREELDTSAFAAVQTLPPGLLVSETGPAGLQAGDLLVCVGAERVRWRFQWSRAQHTRQPTHATVLRDRHLWSIKLATGEIQRSAPSCRLSDQQPRLPFRSGFD